MGGLFDDSYLTQNEAEAAQQQAAQYEAVFTSPVPEAAATAAYVLIPTLDDGEHTFGPCPWPMIVDDDGVPVYPQEGDSALVALSDRGDTWVISWYPAAYFEELRGEE